MRTYPPKVKFGLFDWQTQNGYTRCHEEVEVVDMYEAKETLQLRHQLSASGLSLRAAAYDTRRHHVLTFDSHPLRPRAAAVLAAARAEAYPF